MCISCDFNKAAVIVLMAMAALIAALFVLSDTGREIEAFSEHSGSFVIIFDAGHGGEDGGAVSKNGIKESELNLDIALKSAALADFAGLEHLLTRDSEHIDYPEELKTISKRKSYDTKRRLELVNSTENAVLVSIHQNCFPHASPRGPQVFYGSVEGARELADIIQGSMNAFLYPANRRLAASASSDIYLISHASCPSVLAECGFISNPEEEKLLKTPEYRTKLAVIITAGCMKYLNERCEAQNES